MTGQPIVTQLPLFPASLWPPKKAENQGDLHTFWQHPEQLPPFVTRCPTALRVLDLLGPLHWGAFPERNLQRNWGQPAIPFKAASAAVLIKLNEGLATFGKLWTFFDEHPAFIWLLGFPLVPAPHTDLRFNARASLPTPRHFSYLLRLLPNAALQWLLEDSVQLILTELQRRGLACPDCISVDTKHIVAWVKENNPKAYVKDRFDKQHQPVGDPDCRLGCKRKHNQRRASSTPAANPRPASQTAVGEYYWGYGSGLVVMKVPAWGEFVLAELTQPFDWGDDRYFFPLMQLTEARLGQKPRYGTFDAGFDAWYVYAYFYDQNEPTRGLAAVPFSEKGGYKVTDRHFTPEGLPLCKAGLPMPLKFTFTDRTQCLIEHERGQYVCPLRFPQRTRRSCPVHHARWGKGGCKAEMPTSIGARLRYTLDRDGELYKSLYRQRTACERINSQAVALGIERPHLRNGPAIANQNTLIYVLINLRFLQRLLQNQPDGD